ncbi:hypothetical protein [Kribbella jiaozuonensis]|uniref:Uncharacterized protein n=1 Tax=Kribbella jiaozuonensis TaxID=2575441 RepID=A0A4U3LV85_9ACTN|nr:hypothetical protein [Kribbella jiaozuonensis]TKK80025.1 hypothetical protein FDA38_16900 [Kribbella jiaozuonensis]
MGVDVALTQVIQPGTSGKRRQLTQLDVVPDPADVFPGICQRSNLPMLRRVDPYRDLILTAAEMPQLLAELQTERTLATTDEERTLLTAVHHLAERCATDPPTELHLQGD